MTVVHIVGEGHLKRASGVGTFVRGLDAELRAQGVDSRLVTDFAAFVREAGSPSVLHIHGLWTPLQHRAAVWARRKGVPVVWSTHGMTAPWAMRHRRWKKLLPWWLYQHRDLRGAALVHCTTEPEAEWNRALGFAKTCVVPIGTDLAVPAEGSVAPSLSSPRVLLYVGRLHPVKALDRLIEAFAQATAAFRGEGTRWVLRLVGPDEGRCGKGLVALCDRLGLGRSGPDAVVRFVGPKYGADLEREYADCTSLALVSHTENFGATVVDALAHAKPVLTSTNTPWHVVAERGCGWWVDNSVASLAAALGELFASEAGRAPDGAIPWAEMGRRGRHLAEERHSWPAVAAAMLSAYRVVAATPPVMI